VAFSTVIVAMAIIMCTPAVLGLLLASSCAVAQHVLPLQRHIVDSPPKSGLLRTLRGNGSSIPAGGAVWPTAIYWTMVQVGTPPKDFPVAIDSGSGDLNIAGKGCQGCATRAPNNAYSAMESTTSRAATPFNFSNTYETCYLKQPTAQCTITGKSYTDKVSIAGLGPVDVNLGVIQSQTSNFDQFKVIDGVVGFTGSGEKNVFAQIAKTGACDNVWALCMYEGKSSNGTLTIGGIDERLADGPITYVADVGRQSGDVHSGVHVSQVKIGRDRISVNQTGWLDTGTNVLLLGPKLLNAVRTSMCADASLAHCEALWRNECMELTAEQLKAFPPLSLELDGVSLEMTSEDYLLLGSPLAQSAGQYCLGIRDGGTTAGDGFIIGDTTMRHFYLVFDIGRERIGWAKVNKSNCGSIGGSPALSQVVV